MTRGTWVALGVATAITGCHTYTTIYGEGADAGGCALPEVSCAGVCVDDKTDPLHCGSCSVVCPAASICASGNCIACPAQTVVCGAGGAPYCADIQSDFANCGSCGNVCPHTTTCSQGACVCPLTSCGAVCTDTQTDAQNCGTCGRACDAIFPNEINTCIAGVCHEHCAFDHEDCNKIAGDGCEVDLASDAQNCGECGRSCGVDACAAGMCAVTSVTSSSVPATNDIALDATYVYWASATEIDRAPLAGGSAITLAQAVTPHNVAVDDAYVAWGHWSGLIDTQLLGGSNPIALSSVLGSGTGIAMANGLVYFTTNTGVFVAPRDGSTQASIVTAMAGATYLAVDTTTVYFIGSGVLRVVSASAQNATSSTLAGAGGVTNLAIDTTHVYWTEGGAGSDVSAVAKTGGGTTTIASNQLLAGPIATDGVHVYWALANGAIRRGSVNGGVVMTLANSSPASSIAVDSTYVYWSTTTGISKTTK